MADSKSFARTQLFANYYGKLQTVIPVIKFQKAYSNILTSRRRSCCVVDLKVLNR